MESPELWSHISHTQAARPEFLAVLLARSQDSPVDLLELRVIDENDPLIKIILPHMHHIRTIKLCFFSQQTGFSSGSLAYNVLSSRAPILEHLSIFSAFFAHSALPLDTIDSPFSGVAPVLRTVQLMAISRMPPFFASLPESGRSRIHTLSMGGYRCSLSYQRVETIISLTPSLRILNLELRSWANNPEFGEPPPIPSTLRRLNIRATHSRGLCPQDMLPERIGWDRVPRVHMAFVRTGRIEDFDRQAFLPRNGAPIIQLEVGDEVGTDLMHVRTTHADGCVRMYCGIHPGRAAGLLDNNAAATVRTLVASAAASSATMICAVTWPNISCLRIITDGLQSKVEAFATALAQVVRFGALQRIEYAALRQWDSSWDRSSVNEILSRTFQYADGAPEVQIVEIPSSERERQKDGIEPDSAWFLQPPFEWK